MIGEDRPVSGAGDVKRAAQMLTGEVNPSGRLPVTWPVDEAQLPRPEIPGWTAGPTDMVKADYNIEGSDVGYRWFARQRLSPRYWFGHGLSYTEFQAGGLKGTGGRELAASFDVANRGKRAGQHVVQLYLTATPGASPVRRLLAFKKVALEPGQTTRVTLDVDPRLLARYDVAARGWRIDRGDYQISVGANAGEMEARSDVRLDAMRF